MLNIHPAVIIVPCLLFISFVIIQMYYGWKEDKAVINKMKGKYPKAEKKDLVKEAELNHLLDEWEMEMYHKN